MKIYLYSIQYRILEAINLIKAQRTYRKMNDIKTIDYRFKIIYALGIIMVVCAHTLGGGISILSDWFPYEGLHLAMFAFCSGYFYKPSSEKYARKYIIKKIRHLILPLYIYTLIYGIIVQILKIIGFKMGEDITLNNLLIMPITNGHQFIYNMGGWFIVPLFMVEMYNLLLRKLFFTCKIHIPEIVLFVLNITLGLMGNQLACMGYTDNWWLVLVRTLYFVPFYGLGIFYKSSLEKYYRHISGIWYFTFIFTAKLVIVYAYGKMPSYTPSWCNGFTEGPIIPIVTAYLGIAFWLRIATIAEPIIGKNKYINLIADNTYSIMMNQFLGFMAVKTIYALLNKYTNLCNEFDWVSYKTNIWWYYKPKGLDYTLIIYAIAGIVFSIFIQIAVNKLKEKFYFKSKDMCS